MTLVEGVNDDMGDHVVDVDADEFTDFERKLILQVIQRDEDFRLQERNRLEKMKNEVRTLRESGVPDDEEQEYSNACKRCRTSFQLVRNPGAPCPNCTKKVCKDCRVPVKRSVSGDDSVELDLWTCTLCAKYRDLRGESGAWFYSNMEATDFQKCGIYGSMMLKRAFSVNKKNDPFIYKDPVWDEIVEAKDDQAENGVEILNNHYLLVSNNEEEEDEYGLEEVSITSLAEAQQDFEILPHFEDSTAVTTLDGVQNEVFHDDIDAPHATELGPQQTPQEVNNQHNHVVNGQHNEEEEEEEDDCGEDVVRKLCGEVQISLYYDHDDTTFKVYVHKAINLASAGTNKASARPYAKVYLTSAARQIGKRKTKVVKDTLSPDFDEVLCFPIEHEEIVGCVCTVSVWHYEFSNNNICIGEVDINIQEFISSGFSLDYPSPQWYTLQSRNITLSQLHFCGSLVMSLQYKAPGSQVAQNKRQQRKLPNPTKGEFKISVIEVKDVDFQHQSYCCKMSLVLSSKNILKMKSQVVQGNTSGGAQWDEYFTVSNISWVELQEAYLSVSIRGGTSPKVSNFVGGCRLGLGHGDSLNHDSFGDEVRVWEKMLADTNVEHMFVVPLRNSLQSVKDNVVVPQKQVLELSHEDYEVIKSRIDSSNFRKAQTDTESVCSVESVYSNAGGMTGQLNVTGEILLSMQYDTATKTFQLKVHRAKGIAAVDTRRGTSDPYCKIYLLPDTNKTTKRKTSTCRKTLDPVWEETMTYHITREDLLKKVIQVSIFNNDAFGRNDFLGEMQVNMLHYASTNRLDEMTPVWYTLQQVATVIGGAGSLESRGDLKVGVKFDHEVLQVQVVEANGLHAVDPTHPPDVFVKCHLLPDRWKDNERKTTIQHYTTTPVWNETVTYEDIQLDELYSRVLEITVWNHKDNNNEDHNQPSHQFLGGLRLGLGDGEELWHDSYGCEVDIWEQMMKHLGMQSQNTVPLRPSMTSRKVVTGDGGGSVGAVVPTMPPIAEENEPEMSIIGDHPTDAAMLRISIQYIAPPVPEETESKKKNKPKGSLKVHIKEAKNLPFMDDIGYPSTFCKAFLHPRRKSKKQKTETFIKSINPSWEQEMTFEGVTLDELRHRALEVVVYDEINEREKEMIGYVRLGSGMYIESWDDSGGVEVEIWQSMLSNPSTSIMTSLPLRLAGMEDEEEGDEDELIPYDSDGSLLSEENEDNEGLNAGAESPRSAALRAMGIHAVALQEMLDEDLVNLGVKGNEETIDEAIPLVAKNDVPAVSPAEQTLFLTAMNDNVDLEEEFRLLEGRKKKPTFSLLKRSGSSESLTSGLSDESSEVYGHVPIRGEIQFGTKYDFSSNSFEVHIFQAKDIASVDTKKEISDPYCKVYLLPDRARSAKRKTTTRRKTLNPEWEEILEWKIPLRNLRTRTLWVAVWHPTRFGRNIFLGEVMVDMGAAIDDGSEKLGTSTPQWYTLCERAPAPSGDLYKGEIRFAIMFEDKTMFSKETTKQTKDETDGKDKKKGPKDITNKGTGKINVHIKECYDLPSADLDGFSDPYCKCYLLPMKSGKSKRKTPTIRHSLNPVWDYKFEYMVDYEDLAMHGIEFCVWDWDRGVRNDFLGCSRINLGSRDDMWNDGEGVEIEAWQHLIDNPNTWKEFLIPLRSKRDPR